MTKQYHLQIKTFCRFRGLCNVVQEEWCKNYKRQYNQPYSTVLAFSEICTLRRRSAGCLTLDTLYLQNTIAWLMINTATCRSLDVRKGNNLRLLLLKDSTRQIRIWRSEDTHHFRLLNFCYITRTTNTRLDSFFYSLSLFKNEIIPRAVDYLPLSVSVHERDVLSCPPR